MSTSTPNEKPYVRLATIAEVEVLSEIAVRAFIHDPVINYVNNVDHLLDVNVDLKDCKTRLKFYCFLLKAALSISGRITVVVEPKESKIVACAIWLPPKRRLSVWKVGTLIRAGMLPVLKQWGLTGLLRIVVDYQENAEKMLKKCFETKNKNGPVDDSWYLQLAFTDPECQNRGYLSLLIREAFDHAPEATFVLEATTVKSRDRYLHLGFENPIPIKFGGGKADALGLKKHKKDSTGIEIWAMAKWPKYNDTAPSIDRSIIS